MRSLLLDFYGVVVPMVGSKDRSWVEDEAGLSATGAAYFWQCYHQHLPELLTGEVSEQAWWEHLAQEAGVHRVDLARLAAADVARKLPPPTPRLAQVVELVADGVPVGVIANASVSVARQLRLQHKWLEELDAVVFSCDIALLLPNPRVFSVALDAMGVSAREATFVSADLGHVAAAEAAGLDGVDIATVRNLKELI